MSQQFLYVRRKARRGLCYIAVRKLGYKCSDVSKAMGISAVTVSKAVSFPERGPAFLSSLLKLANESGFNSGRQTLVGQTSAKRTSTKQPLSKQTLANQTLAGHRSLGRISAV